MNHFHTSEKEILKPYDRRLAKALRDVASDWRALGHAIRKEDAYASHVSEDTKDLILSNHLKEADRIESGKASGFTFWQRTNEKLTGDCVALLP